MRRANVLVLLLIGIVGGGLLLEFVVSLRHSESAIGCENHLRQVAIGVQSYNETYGVLPMAVVPVRPPGQPFSPTLGPGGSFKGVPVERRSAGWRPAAVCGGQPGSEPRLPRALGLRGKLAAGALAEPLDH